MKASKSSLRNAQIVPTGISVIDELMSGGVGLKRISQFSGAHSVGKTTIALNIVANAQKGGLETLWLDSELRFPFEKAEALGVKLGALELAEKQFAEDLFDFSEKWAKKHEGVIILDSIGGLLTRGEAEKNSGEEGFPQAPKLIPAWIRRMVLALAEGGSALVLLNHEKYAFDGTLKVLGGKSVEFHSDKWIRFRRVARGEVKKGDNILGETIEVTAMKGAMKGQKRNLTLMSGSAGFSTEEKKKGKEEVV